MCKFAVMISLLCHFFWQTFKKPFFFWYVFCPALVAFSIFICCLPLEGCIIWNLMLKYFREKHCRSASPQKKVLPHIKSSESLLKFLVCEGHPIRWHSYGLAVLISVLYLIPFNAVSSLKSCSGFVLFFPETRMEHWNECLLMLLDRLSVERLLLLCH